jgi:hypothetical protein
MADYISSLGAQFILKTVHDKVYMPILSSLNSHTHKYAGSSSVGGSATSAVKLDGFTSASTTATTWGTLTAANGFTHITTLSGTGGADIGFWAKSGALYAQIDGFFYQNEGKYLVLDTNNFSSYAATSSHTHAYASKIKVNGTEYAVSSNMITLPAYPTIPTSLPASDVYAWAKAATKPTYSASEISGLGTAATLNTVGILSAVTHSDHNNNQGVIVNRSFMTYWNGAYNSGGSSNLAYCNKGAFGDMATKTARNYVSVSEAQTISGAKTFSTYVTASGYKVSNATGFLKADGTVDNTNYSTTSHSHDNYLPYAGGTLTGALTSQNITPSANGTYDLGSSSVKYRTVYAGTFSGNATTATTATNLANFQVGTTTGVNADNQTTAGHVYYSSNGPTTALGASTTDGALYVQAYNSSWVAQIAQDYRNGRLFVRGKNNGTWQTWKRIAQYDEIPTAVSALTNDKGYLTAITKAQVEAVLTGAITSHTHSYAGSSSAGGAATSANKLNTNAGSSTLPVYFANGVPVAVSTTTGIGISITGNANTATKLAASKTIALDGSVTGSASFDGSGNITISTSTNHTHSYLPLSGGACTGEIASSSANAFRLSYGSYGTILRNDGGSFYILLTASGAAASGTWNSLRPFTISLATGGVAIGHTLNVGGAASLSSTLGVSGATTLSNTLTVSGVVTANSTLNVKGTMCIYSSKLSAYTSIAEIYDSYYKSGNKNVQTILLGSTLLFSTTNHDNMMCLHDDGTMTMEGTISATGAIKSDTGIWSGGYISGVGSYSTSDIRLKHKVADVLLRTEVIANSPMMRFEWKKNPSLGVDVGTSAQYWNDILPEAVRTNEDGFLSVDYGKIATVSVVSLANTMLTYEQRIKELESEIDRLKQTINK